MRWLVLLILIAAAVACTSRPTDPEDADTTTPVVEGAAVAQRTPIPFRCGVAREPVKTWSDHDAARVAPAPVDTTVHQLVGLPAPKSLPQSHRVAPVELTTYRLHVRLVQVRLEADADYHIVVADPDTGETLIVESPDPRCVKDAAHRQQLTAARKLLAALFGEPSPLGYVRRLSGTATVIGVGFWDEQHQPGHVPTGAAKSAIELHPLLSISVP